MEDTDDDEGTNDPDATDDEQDERSHRCKHCEREFNLENKLDFAELLSQRAQADGVEEEAEEPETALADGKDAAPGEVPATGEDELTELDTDADPDSPVKRSAGVKRRAAEDAEEEEDDDANEEERTRRGTRTTRSSGPPPPKTRRSGRK